MFASFNLFGKEISMYALMAALGLIAVLIMLFAVTKKPEYRRDQILHIIMAAAGGALIGAHLFFFFTQIPLLIESIKSPSEFYGSFKNVLRTLYHLFGGMVYYGGLFGGLIGAWIYCKKLKIDFGLHLDAATPGIPLFHGFGRIGCLLGGCCYGVASEYGVYFPYSATADPNVKYFPIQIVESAANFIFFAILLFMFRKGIMKGRLLWVYLSVYAIARFILEFFRGDEVRGIFFGMSTSQWISAALFAWCIGYWIMAITKAKRKEPEKV